jgi:protein HIRA/HIR1
MRLLKVPKPESQSGSKFTALELDKDSARLFAARSDGFVNIWDYNSLIEVSGLETPSKDDIDALAASSVLDVHKGSAISALKVWNKTHLISADVHGRVYKTHLSDKNQVLDWKLLLQHSYQINDVVLLGDVALLATMNKILTYDLATGKELSPITLRSDIRSITIDPFQNFIVAIAFNKSVSVHQLQFINGDILTKKVNNGSTTLQSISNVSKFSWSEVGDKYALPNSNLDPSANTIGIIAKKSWKPEFSLVGHACTVVRFNPKTFYNPETKKHYNIVASAGIDKSLAVWNTSFQRPLFTASDVSKSSIDDVIWGTDGLSLIVATDSLIVLSFKQSEFGEFAPDELVNDLKAKVVKPDPIAQPKLEEKSTLESTTHEPQVSAPSNNNTSNDSNGPKQPATTKSTAKSVKVMSPVTSPATNTATTTTNGKKRIAPTLLSSVNGSKTVQSSPKSDDINTVINQSTTTMDFDKPSYSVPKDLKRREEFNSTDQPAKKKKEIEAVEFIGSVAINPSTSFAKLRISTPRIRSYFTLDSPNDDSLTLDIRNGSGNEQKPTKIALLKNTTKQIFVDFIPKLVGLATGGEGFFWAISTVEGIIHVYGDSGRRLLPPLVIGTPLSFLESKGQYLLAVSSIGEVFAWDVASKKALFTPASLYPLLSRSNPDLLTRAENLTLCGISALGVPIVTVSNGNGYLYDKEMESWTLISDSWWAFGSQYWDATDKKVISGSVINLLEKKTNDEIIRRGRGKFLQKMAKTMLMKEGYENLEKTISLAHLENRILISKKLKEADEFKNYLIIYCRRISEMGYKSRLQEVFQELLGPQSPSPNWDPKILSFEKHELLKELIFVCASNRSVQRVLIPFATALNILDQTPLFDS